MLMLKTLDLKYLIIHLQKHAFEAAKKFHYDTVLSPDAKKARFLSKAVEKASVKKNTYTKEINDWTENWFRTNTKN